MNILAVDDDELQLTMLAATLSDQGIPYPTTATSAAMATKAIDEALYPFDLFLLDIQMPGTDGIELCKQIRALPGYEDAPIIMITALTDKPSIERAFEAGAVDYVTKPFDKLELVTRIKIADQITKAKEDACHQKRELTELRQSVYEAGGSTPEAPVTILGIPSVLDYFLLKNFMLELPLSATYSAAAFAVKIDGFESFYYVTNPGIAYELLALVATSLSEQMLGRGYFIAYAGAGVFVCATRLNAGVDLEELSADVNRQIGETTFVEHSGRHIQIGLTFGELQTNSLLAINRRTGLLQKAVSSVQTTAEKRARYLNQAESRRDSDNSRSLASWLAGGIHG